MPDRVPQDATDDAPTTEPAETTAEADGNRATHGTRPAGAVSAPPPGGEAEGPLYAAWGAAMRLPALRESLGGGLGIPAARELAEHADPATIRLLREEADAERSRPWPQPLASSYARYSRDGNRTEYEAQVFERERRTARAVLLAAAATDPGSAEAVADLDEAVDGLIQICEQSTWSWAAHDDAGDRRGFVIPDAGSPYVDLGAGEVVSLLAVADRLIGERLDERWPGVRERIRHEAELRVFTPYLERDDLWWLGYWREVNNWNPWVNGNVVTAAVLLVDDPERRARIVARALESLDRFAAVLPEDGAIDEGFSYWWAGAGRLLDALLAVSEATDGALDVRAVPLLRELVLYPVRMHIGGDWYVNVADGRARTDAQQPWRLLHHWGRLLGDDAVTRHAASRRRTGEPVASLHAGIQRTVRALTDRAWAEARADAGTADAVSWLPSVQLMTARRGRLFVAAKGGHNDENHNHRDVGSYIVAVDGRPFAIDIGKPEYTAQTFSADRYLNPVMRSAWHNVPAPLGREQGTGRAFAATVLREPTDADPRVRLDLTAAYPDASSAWTRDIELSPERVVVTDVYADAPGSVVHVVVSGEVEASGASVVVTADGAAARISTLEGVVPEVERWRHGDDEVAGMWGEELVRLSYRLPGEAGTLTTVFEAAS